jgi:hypothetical protein
MLKEYMDSLTIGDLREVFKCDKLSYKDALPVVREFRDKHNLTDRQALDVFAASQKMFQEST